MVDNVEKKFTDPKLGLCGFKNMGNTCYMNSILQLLIHSRTLVNFLQCDSDPFILMSDDDSMVDLILKNEIQAPFIKYFKECGIEKLADLIRKHMKLTPNDAVDISIGDLKIYLENTLTIKLAEIINTIIYRGNSCISPTGFKKIIDKKIPSLRGFSQQDSHELLIGIIDIMIEETGIDCEPTINNVPQVIKEFKVLQDSLMDKIKSTTSIEEKKKYILEFNKYKKDKSEIVNKFNGLKYMKGVFETKRKNSFDTLTTGYNPMIFNLLTFNMNVFRCLDCDGTTHKFEFNTILSLEVKSTLDECFKYCVRKERIERKCEFCQSKNSTKQKQIWRPGMLLFIQLCRFSHMPNGRIMKNIRPVEIPDTIDISEYCDNTMRTEKTLGYKYKLKGISNHMGSLNAGHYTADGLSLTDNKTWYHFDDSRVGRHQSESIDTTNAYILMYEMEMN
jgi:ubiquitin C-terminal hydrolase